MRITLGFVKSLIVIVLVLALVTGVTYAYFTVNTEEMGGAFLAGSVRAELNTDPANEVFVDLSPGALYSRAFAVDNVSTVGTKARVRLVPVWQKRVGRGEFEALALSMDGIVLSIDGWREDPDGFFYLDGLLEPGENFTFQLTLQTGADMEISADSCIRVKVYLEIVGSSSEF